MAGLNRVTPGTGITSAWGNTTSAKTIRNFTSLAAAQAAITAAGITPEAGEVIYCADTDQLYRYRLGTWYPHGAKDAARGYATAGSTLVAAGFADINLGGESYDYGSRFAASKYTAPYTGLYDIRFRVSFGIPAGTIDTFAVVRKGASTELCRGQRNTTNSGGTSAPSSNGADVVPLTAGDVVKLSAYVSAGGANVSFVTPEETFLSVRPAA